MFKDLNIEDRQGASLKRNNVLGLEHASPVLATQSWGIARVARQSPTTIFMHVLCSKTLVGLYRALRAPQIIGLFQEMGMLWEKDALSILPRLLGRVPYSSMHLIRLHVYT
jgi:hypothetical protein